MFINLSNHPSRLWNEKQIYEAKKYGEVIDYPFPNVSANYTENDIKRITNKVVDDIMKLVPDAVMCQGEFTLTYSIVNELNKRGIVCLSACANREIVEWTDVEGIYHKESKFIFEKYRKY